MDIVYWALVAAGGATLVAEAYRQYTTPVSVHPNQRYPILKGVELEALCANGELLRGFLIYVSIYLGAYAAILGSSELWAVVREADPAGRVIGAQGDAIGPDTNPVLADRDNYGKPIYVSAAIIAALSMGIFAPIERAVRSYAHRIAGIPRGIYLIISRLHRVDYKKLSAGYAMPLERQFLDRIGGGEGSEDGPGVAEEIRDLLREVDMLAPAVAGDMRDQIFPAFRLPKVDEMIAAASDDLTDLRALVASFEASPEALQRLHLKAELMRNNLMALFSVLYIRSDGARARVPDNTPTGGIFERLNRERDPILHSLAAALIATGFLTIFGTLGVYLTMSGAVYGRPLFENGFNPDLFFRMVEESAWNAARWMLIFLVAGMFAYWARVSAEEREVWPLQFGFNRGPWGHYLRSAVIPGAMVVLAMILFELAKISWAGGGLPTATQLDEFRRNGADFCVFAFFFGMVATFSILMTIDQHARLSAARTIGLALGWALVFAFICGLGISLTYFAGQQVPNPMAWLMRETLIMSVPAAVFFTLFAGFVEWAEE